MFKGIIIELLQNCAAHGELVVHNNNSINSSISFCTVGYVFVPCFLVPSYRAVLPYYLAFVAFSCRSRYRTAVTNVFFVFLLSGFLGSSRGFTDLSSRGSPFKIYHLLYQHTLCFRLSSAFWNFSYSNNQYISYYYQNCSKGPVVPLMLLSFDHRLCVGGSFVGRVEAPGHWPSSYLSYVLILPILPTYYARYVNIWLGVAQGCVLLLFCAASYLLGSRAIHGISLLCFGSNSTF
jgi:hypothetical protein